MDSVYSSVLIMLLFACNMYPHCRCIIIAYDIVLLLARVECGLLNQHSFVLLWFDF